MKNSLAKELSLSTESGIEPSFIKSNAVQSGRSMIEMLGVLAIIGVLSVGGIMGYSKAMMKYRINKTADQVATIVANTRTLFASQKKYTGLGGIDHPDYTLIKKARLFPDEMYTGSAADSVENAFGGKVELTQSGKYAAGDDKAFVLALFDIPEEACMELLTMDWGSGSSSGLISVGKYISFTYSSCDGNAGNENTANACPNGKNVSVPMPVSVAANACSTSDAASSSGNILMWKYY